MGWSAAFTQQGYKSLEQTDPRTTLYPAKAMDRRGSLRHCNIAAIGWGNSDQKSRADPQGSRD
jgi:hypothetical protein